jgi:hypothetical protein
MAVRARLFSEARFQFQRMRAGRPGDLYGTPALLPLESPWTNGTTSQLLKRALLDVDLAGNFYAVRRGKKIRRLRPDWVTIIAGSDSGSPIDAEVVGYLYHHGGRGRALTRRRCCRSSSRISSCTTIRWRTSAACRG